ncbi:hypothetical protein [Clostridium sporogenes]|uniref:hypothetical protein n=1 Tax=Clostridium sporogenes TaxID=1509 RepID=UPI0013D37C18|nr:hypothetical protein [Clostridium sporogenes]
MIAIGNYNSMKRKIAKNIKLEKDILKHSGKCISYKISPEEIEEYLSKYNNIK